MTGDAAHLTYIKVFWHHSFPDEPIVLYSEIDYRWERRKVYVFRDGQPVGWVELLRNPSRQHELLA